MPLEVLGGHLAAAWVGPGGGLGFFQVPGAVWGGPGGAGGALGVLLGLPGCSAGSPRGPQVPGTLGGVQSAGSLGGPWGVVGGPLGCSWFLGVSCGVGCLWRGSSSVPWSGAWGVRLNSARATGTGVLGHVEAGFWFGVQGFTC